MSRKGLGSVIVGELLWKLDKPLIFRPLTVDLAAGGRRAGGGRAAGADYAM